MAASDNRGMNRCAHGHLACKFPINVTVPGDMKDAAALMRPAGEDALEKWPVSKRVNSSRAPGDDNDASLIERVVPNPRADADALSALMDDPENLDEIGDLFGQLKSG